MATKHGNKVYIQLLLDPARASLLQKLADEKGLKLSAIARDAVYSWIGSHTESTVFEAAEAQDHAQWRESVQKRLDGRKRNREMRLSAREVS